MKKLYKNYNVNKKEEPGILTMAQVALLNQRLKDSSADLEKIAGILKISTEAVITIIDNYKTLSALGRIKIPFVEFEAFKEFIG